MIRFGDFASEGQGERIRRRNGGGRCKGTNQSAIGEQRIGYWDALTVVATGPPARVGEADFALLSTLYGDGFLRHTNLLRAENLKHHHRLPKHVRQDWLRTPPILNVTELRIAPGAGLARDLAQVVSKPIFDIPRLVEAARDPIRAER